MYRKFIIAFLLAILCLPCFAVRCVRCHKTLWFSPDENDRLCNMCMAKSLWGQRRVAVWKINYGRRHCGNQNIQFIIYSSKTAFENRNKDMVVIKYDGKLLPIQDKKGEVGRLVLELPLYENPARVNILFFDGKNDWTAENVPLATRKYHKITIYVERTSGGSLKFEYWGDDDKDDKIYQLGSGSINPDGILNCSSLADQ